MQIPGLCDEKILKKISILKFLISEINGKNSYRGGEIGARNDRYNTIRSKIRPVL